MDTIFDILDNGIHIVAHNSDLRYLITWNESCTFLLWVGYNHTFENVDIRTHGSSSGLTFSFAREYANKWMDELVSEFNSDE